MPKVCYPAENEEKMNQSRIVSQIALSISVRLIRPISPWFIRAADPRGSTAGRRLRRSSSGPPGERICHGENNVEAFVVVVLLWWWLWGTILRSCSQGSRSTLFLHKAELTFTFPPNLPPIIFFGGRGIRRSLKRFLFKLGSVTTKPAFSSGWDLSLLN